MILLASLPYSYQNFMSTLSVAKECITLEEVKSCLYSRELQHKVSGNGEEASASRLSMTNSAKGQKRKKGKGFKKGKFYPKDICNYCKGPNHWKKDCPNKIKKEFVAVVVQNDSSSENDLVFLVVDQQQHHSEQWVLDSGCFYHMCPHKRWFVTCAKKYNGNVLMDNNVPFKIVGISSIQIKMHDGIVRTLTNVYHVPKLYKNLILVGAMDSKGFTCCVEGEVMPIKRKGKSIVMHGTKQGNLYILQGSTVIDSISTISQAESPAPNDNSLWNMRLGYMSEKGMKIMSKQGLLGNHKVKPLQFCEHNVHGKQHKTNFPNTVHITKATLDYVHFDC